jgi:hypothetical protein
MEDAHSHTGVLHVDAGTAEPVRSAEVTEFVGSDSAQHTDLDTIAPGGN